MSDKNKVIRKAFADVQKEETWINEQCAEGWALVKIGVGGLKFMFEPCQPGEYIYRTEIVTLSGQKKKDYFGFSENAGVELITNQWWNMGLTYFRKKASDGPFELYSDVDGKIRQHGPLRNLYLFAGWIFIVLYILSAINIFMDILLFDATFKSAMASYLWNTVVAKYNLVFHVFGLIVTPLFLSLGYRYRRNVKHLKEEKEIGEEMSIMKRTKSGFRWVVFVTVIIFIMAFILGIYFGLNSLQ
ncbi:MAG: DUF2812 domain-containing protein [Oscillospiraceae bacterium]|nr:DUF2812 domain-containing protein [Oscillospiraceae bacterium]